jgi:hypothetical protein
MKRLLIWTFSFVLSSISWPLMADCTYRILDTSSISYVESDGTTTTYVINYWGWLCTDCCYWPPVEEPHPPGWNGPPSTPPPDAPPPSPPATLPPLPLPGCSLFACRSDCAAEYLTSTGREITLTGTIIRHPLPDFECGLTCIDSANLDFRACTTQCYIDCNLP